MIFVIVVLAIILGFSLLINWAFLYKSVSNPDGVLEVDETDPDDVKMRLVTNSDIDTRTVLIIRIEKKSKSGRYPWGS